MFTKCIVSLVVVTASLLSVSSAQANGCNGVVSQLEWGCAAWDNNNGPQFPHYNKNAAQPQQPTQQQVMGPNGRLISQDGGGIVHPPTGTGR